MTFSDGMEFELHARLHVERRSDGLYVAGEGWLIPVESEEEAASIIADLRASEGRPGSVEDSL